MKLDGFLAGVLIAVGLAFAAPQLGAGNGPLHMSLVTDLGIGLVFFLHGAAVSPDSLRSAASKWRLHLFIQASTFVLFPILGATIYFGLRPWISPELRQGLFYLCAVSSTVSTSVAMTSLGRGDTAAALFNATLSGLIGMVATPLLMDLVMRAAAAPPPLLPQIIAIMGKLLAPFVVGHLARPLLKRFLTEHKTLVNRADRLVILMIIYGAFCEAVASGVWVGRSLLELVETVLLTGALLACALTVTTLGSRALGFSREDEVAAIFCGSKKSLANGAPIAKVVFGASPALGLIVLPLLLYHQMQLIACSVLARRYAARAKAEAFIQPG